MVVLTDATRASLPQSSVQRMQPRSATLVVLSGWLSESTSHRSSNPSPSLSCTNNPVPNHASSLSIKPSPPLSVRVGYER